MPRGRPHRAAGLGWAGLGWAGLGWAGLGWAGPCALQCLSELWQVAATLPAEVAAILREFDVDGDGMLDP